MKGGGVMAWRSNAGPEPTVRELQRRIEELECRIAKLEGNRGDWINMGDRARVPWRDAMAPALPMQPPVFKPAIAPPRWDTATVRSASMTTGAMFAMFSEGVVVACLGLGMGMEWFVPLVVPAATLLFAAPAAWCLFTFTPWTILSTIEKKTGLDINGDGQVGDPPKPEPQRIELEVTNRNEKGRLAGIKNLHFSDIDEDTLIEFLTDIAGGLPLTGPSWQGKSGASLSQSKFAAVMRELERAGYVENKRGNVGRVPTDAGKITLRFLVAPNPLPRKRGSAENE